MKTLSTKDSELLIYDFAKSQFLPPAFYFPPYSIGGGGAHSDLREGGGWIAYCVIKNIN